MQSFPGRTRSFHSVPNKQRVLHAPHTNATWSERQSKDAIVAAKEQEKKDLAEFRQIREARREIPHLLNRAIVI